MVKSGHIACLVGCSMQLLRSSTASGARRVWHRRPACAGLAVVPAAKPVSKPLSVRSRPQFMIRRTNAQKSTTTNALETEKQVEVVKEGTTIAPSPKAITRGGPWKHRLGAWSQRLRRVKILGLDPSPELVAISMVYLVQGILGLSRLALSFFYKDALHMEPAEVAVLTGIAGIPWVIKPLYGFISDSIPLWGYHRRSYLVLAGLTGFSSWVCLCFFVTNPVSAAAAMLGASLSTAASDVLVDSLVVERARDAPQAVAGSLQSLCWGSAAIGGIASAYWSGYLVESFGTRFVFGLTAIFPLVVSLSALLIDEPRIGSSRTLGPVVTVPATTTALSEASGGDSLYKLHAQGASGATSVHHRPGATPVRATEDANPSTFREPERAPLLSSQSSIPSEDSTGAVLRGGDARTADSGGGAAGPGAWAGGAAGAGARSGGGGVVVDGAPFWQQMAVRGRMLWGAISRKDILLPTLFVFVWQATPSAESAMFYFQTNELGFQPEFLGRVRLVGSLASLAGVLLYNTTLKKVPLRSLLWWAMLLGTSLGATQLLLVSRVNQQLGLSDQLFVLGDAALLTALGQASFMPILVLAARLCPQGVEATLFATLMSVLNAGSFVGSGLGAGMTKALGVTSTDFTNLFTLVAICNVCQLLPAPLLRLIPDTLDRPDEDDATLDTPGSNGATAGTGSTATGHHPHHGETSDTTRLLRSETLDDVELQAVQGTQGVDGGPREGHGGGASGAHHDSSLGPGSMGVGAAMHASEGHPKIL